MSVQSINHPVQLRLLEFSTVIKEVNKFLKCKSISDKYSSQVFDATNTTRERRGVIISLAKEKGYKAGAAAFYFYSTVCFIKVFIKWDLKMVAFQDIL